MRRLLPTLVLLALLASIAPARAQVPPDGSIVGGGDVPSPNPYGYQVSIGEVPHSGIDSHYCGGSLIAPTWVLSAAHCVAYFDFEDDLVVTPADEIGVLVGLRDLRDAPARPDAARAVARVIVHPGYDPFAATNDIALLELSAPVADASLIVALAEAGDDELLAPPGTTSIATGWGGLLGYPPGPPPPDQAYPDILQVVELPIVANDVCAVPNPDVGPAQICAGLEEGGKDTCQGDSGGPLVVRDGQNGFVQVGIVSYGQGCAAPEVYGVYTRVSTYRGWVNIALGNVVFTDQLYLPQVCFSDGAEQLCR